MRRGWLALLASLCLATAIPAAAEVPLPRLEARITDLAGALDPGDRQRIEARLEAIERERGAQVAILLLSTTQPETIEQFGIRLAESWKIGHKGRDDGLIVIVAKDDRKVRVEVGYGLEGAIPDALARRVIAERMAPRFRQGDFAGGLADALDSLDSALAVPGAVMAAPAPASTGDAGVVGGERPDWMPWLFMVIVGAGVLRLIFGLFGSLAAAGIGGWLGFIVFGSMPMAIGAAVLVFILSFVNLLSGGSSGGGISGGGFSSGSGGFSGGGGSFGGGGASGDW